MCDLLSQTDPYYDFTLVIEEGLSHGIWTQAQGGTPIVIQPDGDVCFNYLDTQGAPLTNLQITSAAALVAKMAGHPADEDRRSLRLPRSPSMSNNSTATVLRNGFPKTLRVSTS